MPDYTTNLNLAKPNATTEPNNTFNLDTYLNDNWDKLDTFAAETITTDKLVNNLAATENGFALDAKQGKAIGDRLNIAEGTLVDHTTQLSEKANIASPTFTGTPTAPTQATTDNSTKLATTAFINNLLASKEPSNKALSGYKKFADGIIIQWGFISYPTAGSKTTVTFPITFPSAIWMALASPADTNSSATAQVYDRYVGTMNVASNYGGIGICWIAIGC